MREYEIRAAHDDKTITVYQAFSPLIADRAIEHGRFVPPFSLNRMTWIKPSFLWMMERSNWAHKAGQERVLSVRMTRDGWEYALSRAVLTVYERGLYRDADEWRRQFDAAEVIVQWDPERNLRGASQPYKSIQVGLSRHIIARYVDEWIVELRDVTALAHKCYEQIRAGHSERASALLPRERVYPTPPAIARRIGMELR